MRTTNQLERLNRELKRRTRVATLFPNEASLLRLVTGVLMEISEEWETENVTSPLKNRKPSNAPPKHTLQAAIELKDFLCTWTGYGIIKCP